MSELNAASTLQALNTRGLITEAQLKRALSHHQVGELDEHPELLDGLAWLMLRDVVPVEEMVETSRQLRFRYGDEKRAENKQLVDDALERIALVILGLNTKLLDTLLAETIINESQYDAAVQKLSRTAPFRSTGAVLAWMMMEVLDADDRSDLRKRFSEETRSAIRGDRDMIVAEAEKILVQTTAVYRKAAWSELWNQVFPGPRWLWLLLPVVFVGYTAWRVISPTLTPECDSTDLLKSVDGMLFSARFTSRLPPSILRDQLAPPTLRLTGVSEVGYAKVDGTRACIGTMIVGDDDARRPYAFTVKPSEGERGEYVIEGADADLVKARFGHIDEQGDYANQARPVGRDNVYTAFAKGVEVMRSSAASPAFSSRMRERLNSQGLGRVRTDSNRTREVAEVEPLGDCSELADSGGYSCHLLVEYNDPFLNAIMPMGSSILDGKFTFQRDVAENGNSWRVSEKFAKDFSEAKVQSRLKSVAE